VASVSAIIIIFIGVFALAAATALVRGLLAFHADAEQIRRGAEPALVRHGEKQNRMMMQRVLFQGIAIFLIVLLGLIAAKH
jgi:hypothetical protein